MRHSDHSRRTRIRVGNGEEYRCAQSPFRCLPLHSEHAADTYQKFLCSYGMTVTLAPWHHHLAACERLGRGVCWAWHAHDQNASKSRRRQPCVLKARHLAELGRVPPDERVALWREHLASAMPGAPSACLGMMVRRKFCSTSGRVRIEYSSVRRRTALYMVIGVCSMAKPIGGVHASSGPDACTPWLGFRWPCRRRPQVLQNRPTASCANVRIFN